jgi:hypothetical protein
MTVKEAVGEPREIACVISWGEGADRHTRGRVRSPSHKMRSLRFWCRRAT